MNLLILNTLMYINSGIENFTRLEQAPGGYEWWYFDAIDFDNDYRLAVTFYIGNPISSRYQKARMHNNKRASMPNYFPAVKISIHKGGVPVYVSFREFDFRDCHFDHERGRYRFGKHEWEQTVENGKLRYALRLKERLPSGDALVGQLHFDGSDSTMNAFGNQLAKQSGKHRWNLLLPRSGVEGHLRLFARNEPVKRISFSGTGYHDHHQGSEPLKERFEEWYWGRFHFESGTFIYFSTKNGDHRDTGAWLIDPENHRVIQRFKDVWIEDKSLTLFGLVPGHKITMNNEDVHVTIQQTRVIENGTYYQRYQSDAFLTMPEHTMEMTEGISEYMKPARIHRRFFRPFNDLRIQYPDRTPNWVLKSKVMYRWTW